MKKRNVFAFSLLMLFAISMISAADTKINVKTLPEHDVDVYALRVGETYNLIESFHKKSDSNGSVLVVLSTEEEKFLLKIGVRKDNTMVVSEKFNETYTSGNSVDVEIYPQWYLEQLAIEQNGNFADGNSSAENVTVVNESKSNDTILNDSSLNKTTGSNAITGFFTSLKDGVSGKALRYGVIFILLVGVFYFGFSFLRKRRYQEPAEPKEIIVRKLSEVNDAKKNLIEDAEKKIQELQEHIKKMKGG